MTTDDRAIGGDSAARAASVAPDAAVLPRVPGLVAYSGEPGAFAEDAVLAFCGDVPRRPVEGFLRVFQAVEAGEADLGVVPIENLVNGTVRENYDLLLEHRLEIVGEVVVPVRLCLAALPGESLDRIERVYSHIQALGQAEAFLRSRPWTTLTTYNTAGAGKLIVERGERAAAAVLSPRAAALFGLEVLADDIQSIPDNRTRFVVIARPEDAHARVASPAHQVDGRRTSLAFAVRNEPGTLLRALRAFADHAVNLSRLESRPSRVRAWEYVFLADADADAADPGCAAALEDLRSVSTMVRILGSYDRAARQENRDGPPGTGGP